MGEFDIISARDAKEIMDRGDPCVILDVRTREEYEAGHIKGAVLLPHDTIDADSSEELLPDLEQTILVYCRTGKRAIAAAQKLVELDYSDVRVFGGVDTWSYGLEK